MRRALWQCVKFGALGAVCSLAAGWTCVVAERLPRQGSNPGVTEDGEPDRPMLESFGWNTVLPKGQLKLGEASDFDIVYQWWARSNSFFGVRRTWFGGSRNIDSPCCIDPACSAFAVKTQAGWPMLSLEGWQSAPVLRLTGFTHQSPWRTHRGLDLDRGAEGSGLVNVILPLRPLWPGLAINTIFYGAAIWMVWAGAGALRRGVRRRRGRCVRCNYDLRGRASGAVVCPECGLGG